DTFIYTVTDNHGESSSAKATITIRGENDAPMAMQDTATTNTGATVTGNVLANDKDIDVHDTLRVTKVNGLDFNVGQLIHGTYGDLTLKADGTYTYVANASLRAASSQGTAQDRFLYSIDDGHLGT